MKYKADKKKKKNAFKSSCLFPFKWATFEQNNKEL